MWLLVALHLWVTVMGVWAIQQQQQQPQQQRRCPGSWSCEDGYGLRGKHHDRSTDWSPFTQSHPPQRSDSHTTAALCTQVFSYNALACSHTMSPFLTSHLSISVPLYYRQVKKLIKFWIKPFAAILFLLIINQFFISRGGCEVVNWLTLLWLFVVVRGLLSWSVFANVPNLILRYYCYYD